MRRMVFLSCGDVSGDRWASHIVQLLRERFPEVSVVALAGEESMKRGASLLENTVSHSLTGFSEAFRALSFWRRTLSRTQEFLKREQPTVLLAIDNPGFNLPLVRFCARQGIPVVYFAPPQVWAWGRWRGKFLATHADYILHFFPWEGKYFAKGKAQTVWVGHPLRVLMEGKVPPRSPHPRAILVLPGSRKNEIRAFFSVFREFLFQYGMYFSEYQFSLVAASSSLRPFLEREGRFLPLTIVDWEAFYPLLGEAALAISTSGTVTLEVALGGVPQVIVYRTSWGTYFFGRLLFRGSRIGLPNILLGEEIAPELVQGRFAPALLFAVVRRMLSDAGVFERASTWAGRIREQLGDGKTFERTVEVISRYL
ncbi:lipid-A-disaccharide synthase [Candidatus Caldatribacterium sp.]|uniref:lipid-A-disaccharide synthase n=1 Tax=Candidatus Caldatribacterium sp. TaxID=2282143 RepID=UPI002993FD0E|nr:hypothetical protein [Candidatus Caldatribacterium sp.]MDW8080401.1 hypothetical protein [Candidatus Calescibacterium sp.]